MHEINSKLHDVLNKMDPRTAIETLYNDYLEWVQQEPPYNKPIAKHRTARDWWEQRARGNAMRVLPVICVKIHSVIPNSMFDERTTSTFTWMNTALRNRQKVASIKNKVQIRQHYLNDPQRGGPTYSKRFGLAFRDLDSFRTSEASTRNESRGKGGQEKEAAEAEADGLDMDDESKDEMSDIASLDDDDYMEGNDDTFEVGNIVDLDSLLLCNVLSDEPLITSEAEGTKSKPPAITPSTSDDNFDMSAWTPLS
ncbi:hypothetical protein CPB86DRAFT_386798 [Serendipita vermifera]|nr:hypothetical protein CPB86DRAFT_386798 [Serendipita vermifera]